MQVNDDDGLPTYIAAVLPVRRKCIGTSMTAQLSEYATSSPMAGDENGGGSSSNDSGGGDESAAGRRVVMIAFKMEDNNCDVETVAGPSRDDSNSEPHAIVLQQQSPPPPSFSSDGNTAGKTAYFIALYNVILCIITIIMPDRGWFPSVVWKNNVYATMGSASPDVRVVAYSPDGAGGRGATLSLFYLSAVVSSARSPVVVVVDKRSFSSSSSSCGGAPFGVDRRLSSACGANSDAYLGSSR